MSGGNTLIPLGPIGVICPPVPTPEPEIQHPTIPADVTNRLSSGRAWLEGRRMTQMSSIVAYRRGSQSYDLSATLGRTQYEAMDEYGLTIQAEATDFLFTAVYFTLALGKPRPGDRIVHQGVTYEVMDLGRGGAWRWADAYRTTLRVHAKEVG